MREKYSNFISIFNMKSLFFSFMIAACTAVMMTGCSGGGGDSDGDPSLSITEQQFKTGSRSICLVSHRGVQLKFIVQDQVWYSGSAIFGGVPKRVASINLSDVQYDEAGNIKSCVFAPTFEQLKLDQSPILDFFQFPAGLEKDQDVSLGNTELKFQLDFTTGTYVLPIGEDMSFFLNGASYNLEEWIQEDSISGTLYVDVEY